MNIHYFQHESFEGLGCIEDWLQKGTHRVTYTRFWENAIMPAPDTIDLLIVMGGSMGAYDDQKYDWMPEEKKFIASMIGLDKAVLGICLGAQLLASIMGAKVYPGKHKEIGWWEVEKTPESLQETLFNVLPQQFISMHWHGDTFDLPKGAIRLASSKLTLNQAFSYRNVIGIQFHPEMNEQAIRGMIDATPNMIKGNYVQSAEEILQKIELTKNNNVWMAAMLENLVSRI